MRTLQRTIASWDVAELCRVAGIFFFLLTLGDQRGCAQTPTSSEIELACVGSNGFTVHVAVDERSSTVSVNGSRLTAIIDHNMISFKQQAYDGTTYYQHISRLTGKMIIQYGNTSRIETYDCEKARRKF
jgi:hypothetical protein